MKSTTAIHCAASLLALGLMVSTSPVAQPAAAPMAAVGQRNSPLADLIQAGRRDEALAQVEAGADVNAAQPDGTSPLHWATYRVDAQLVRALIAKGARADTRNAFGASPLSEAARIGNVELAELLLKAGANIEVANDDGQTPLMLAASAGSLPVLQLLLKRGAEVNPREGWRGQTALMWAAAGRQPEMVKLLVRRGAKVDVRAEAHDWSGKDGAQVTSEPRAQYKATGGLTALLYAARSGCEACVDALLDGRADIDLPTPEGVTPLMIALDNVNYDVAMKLLARGANPHLADWWGRTALYIAVDANSLETRTTAGGTSFASYGGEPDPSQKADAIGVTRRLLELGVEVDPQLNMHRPGRGGNSGRFVDTLLTTGATPLLRAASGRDFEMVEVLLKGGAKVDLPNALGVTPLMSAASLGMTVAGLAYRDTPLKGVDVPTRSIRTIDLLLAAGADVNARLTVSPSRTSNLPRNSPLAKREGQSALYGAINWGDTAVIQHLIDKGARVDVVDDAGASPMDAAKQVANGRDPEKSAAIAAMLRSAAVKR